MYHTEIEICRKLKQIATKKQQKTPNVRAHCVAEPDANQRRNFLIEICRTLKQIATKNATKNAKCESSLRC